MLFTRHRLFLLSIASGALALTIVAIKIPAPDYPRPLAYVLVGDAGLWVEIVTVSEKDGPIRINSLIPENSEGVVYVSEPSSPFGVFIDAKDTPVDFLWISGGIVVDIEEAAPHPEHIGSGGIRYESEQPAEFLLQTRAGFIATHAITIGDPAEAVRPDEEGIAYVRSGMLHASRSRDTSGDIPELLLPGSEYFIETIRQRARAGADFRVGELVQDAGAYKKYAIRYRSGDLEISGVMNVPHGPAPAGGFPILILNHGLIHPSVYYSGRGSRREQDFFARNGYATIHPDYRGHAESDPNPSLRHDFYAGYAEDVMNLVDALKKGAPPFLDADRMGMWGHSMGGGIAARVMVVVPDIKAYVLFASISADAEENFYELTPQEIEWLYVTYGPAGSETYRRISPIEHFKYVAAPVQLHHGSADKDVPIRFSEDMASRLEELGKPAEFFSYPGEPHEFINAWTLAANRSLQFFDFYVKGTGG